MNTRIQTPEWDLFLEQLSREPNISKAARAAGLPLVSCYKHRERSPDFRRAWDEAINEAVDRIEEELHRRAVDGVDEPVFYQGMRCGHVRKYSDPLLALYVKRWRPEYRERSTVDMNAKVAHEPLTEADREKAVGEILAKAYARMAAQGQDHGPSADDTVPEDFDLG